MEAQAGIRMKQVDLEKTTEKSNEKELKSFEYTYSAREQAEIENIRKKYLPTEESPMEQLRRLDKSVERPGTVVAIMVGIVGTLVMGFGMSLCMVWAEIMFAQGIIIGILGIGILAAAYPLYRKITKKQKEKLAPQILALVEEVGR